MSDWTECPECTDGKLFYVERYVGETWTRVEKIDDDHVYGRAYKIANEANEDTVVESQGNRIQCSNCGWTEEHVDVATDGWAWVDPEVRT